MKYKATVVKPNVAETSNYNPTEEYEKFLVAYNEKK
jgi:hypothetical protein